MQGTTYSVQTEITTVHGITDMTQRPQRMAKVFIFRFEHKRDVCTDTEFGKDGRSLTGHGTFTMCPGMQEANDKPNFGLTGRAPGRIMSYERVAVTAQQFSSWIGNTYACMTPDDCVSEDGYQFCTCPPSHTLTYNQETWGLFAYWVEDSQEGIDWRIDSHQIVFNPAFAINMGEVSLSDAYDFGAGLVATY